MFRRLLPVFFLILPGAATAQQVFCLDRNSGGVNAAATQAFADMQARMDGQLAQTIAGTWYGETQSPQTGQVSRLYVTYGADGSLSYQNQVCDGSGACSQYQGQGAWAGMQTAAADIPASR